VVSSGKLNILGASKDSKKIFKKSRKTKKVTENGNINLRKNSFRQN